MPPLAYSWLFGTLWIFSAGMALAAPAEIVFAAYNVRNYVAEPPPGPHIGRAPARPKTEASLAVLVRIVAGIQPDVLGLCEMGGPEQLADFQRRLKAAGVDLPFSEHVPGSDEQRHLALLSRFPLAARQSQPEFGYELLGVPRRLERGLLDVTVQVTPTYQLRLLGVHLKSKLATADGADLIRRHEAARLRQHVEAVLASSPETNLLLYGDFNDGRDSPTLRELLDRRGEYPLLDDLAGADPQGDRWTHYYPAADTYERLDYLLASRALWPELRNRKAFLARDPEWFEASDHRPIFVHIRPENRPTPERVKTLQ